jgi:hypothetical protein
MYGYSRSVSHSFIRELTAVTLTEQRHAQALHAQTALQLALVETNAARASSLLYETVTATNAMLQAENDLYVGTTVGFKTASQSSRDERILTTQDGCYLAEDRAACVAAFDGLITKGLHTAVLSFADLLMQLVDSRRAEIDTGNSTTRYGRIVSEKWQAIQKMGWFVERGCERAASMRVSTILSMNESYDSVTRVAGVSVVLELAFRDCHWSSTDTYPVYLRACIQTCFVLAVVGSYLFQYMPMLRRLNAMLKRTRGMLLLFPDDVIRGVEVVRSAMQAYTLSKQ